MGVDAEIYVKKTTKIDEYKRFSVLRSFAVIEGIRYYNIDNLIDTITKYGYAPPRPYIDKQTWDKIKDFAVMKFDFEKEVISIMKDNELEDVEKVELIEELFFLKRLYYAIDNLFYELGDDVIIKPDDVEDPEGYIPLWKIIIGD